MLDKYAIKYADEPSIRRKLRKRGDCKTSANQLFLRKNSQSVTIDRKKEDTRNVLGIVIPSTDVPESFFTGLKTYGKYTNALYIVWLATCTPS